jgi:hypothetical protein
VEVNPVAVAVNSQPFPAEELEIDVSVAVPVPSVVAEPEIEHVASTPPVEPIETETPDTGEPFCCASTVTGAGGVGIELNGTVVIIELTNASAGCVAKLSVQPVAPGRFDVYVPNDGWLNEVLGVPTPPDHAYGCHVICEAPQVVPAATVTFSAMTIELFCGNVKVN